MRIIDRFVITVVFRDVQDDRVLREGQFDPVTVFGTDGLREFVEQVASKVADSEETG